MPKPQPHQRITVAIAFFVFLVDAALGIAEANTTCRPLPEASEPVPPGTPYGQGMVNLMGSMSRLRTETILMGDSMAAAWPRDLRDSIFPKGSINFGAGGDTTFNLLWRIRQAVPNDAPYKTVIIFVGTNDLRHIPACKTASNLRLIVETVHNRAPLSKIFVINILPRGGGLSQFSDNVVKANDAIRENFQAPFVTLVDGWTLISEQCKSACNLLRQDHLHLTVEGYTTITNALKAAMPAQN